MKESKHSIFYFEEVNQTTKIIKGGKNDFFLLITKTQGHEPNYYTLEVEAHLCSLKAHNDTVQFSVNSVKAHSLSGPG